MIKFKKFLPTLKWERLCRKELDQKGLTPFCKWEGLFFTWGKSRYMLAVRRVKDTGSKDMGPTAFAPA